MLAYQDYLLANDDLLIRQAGDQRSTTRVPVYRDLPWRLLINVNQEALQVRPLDVSRRGLGILLDKALPAGTRLYLAIEGKPVILEVVYSQEWLGLGNLFKVGLFVREGTDNLLTIFEQRGLLKKP